jgi:adapter protein MecA 1/2
MEFKRINENTFECLLSKEDLEDFDMTMEDFLKDQEKTLDFMRKIIERSEEEIDFEPTGEMVSMQISPLPGEGLALVFSNRKPMSGMDLLNHVRDILRSHMEGIAEDQEQEEEEEQSFEPGTHLLQGEKHEAGFMDLNSIMEDVLRQEPEKNKKRNAVSGARAYRFRRFSDLERFCKSWNSDKPVKSQLIKYGNDTDYLLVIEQGKLSKQAYAKLGEALAEYAYFVTDQPLKITGIREHGTVVIDKNAVVTLRDL